MFPVAVVGTCPDPAFVEAKLGEVLARKLRSHAVFLNVLGPARFPTAVFAVRHNLPVEVIPDAETAAVGGRGVSGVIVTTRFGDGGRFGHSVLRGGPGGPGSGVDDQSGVVAGQVALE